MYAYIALSAEHRHFRECKDQLDRALYFTLYRAVHLAQVCVSKMGAQYPFTGPLVQRYRSFTTIISDKEVMDPGQATPV